MTRSAFHRLLFGTGLLAGFRWARRRRMRILAYHNIGEEEDEFSRGFDQTLSPGTLRRQLSYIMRHYKVIPLSALVDAQRRQAPVEQAVALTFDDGGQDNYMVAYPILRELGLPAAFFVPTDLLDGERVAWAHALNYLHGRHGPALLTALRQRVGRPDAPEAGTGLVAWVNYLAARCRRDDLLALTDALCGDFAWGPAEHRAAAHRLYLTWEMARAMRSGGMEFGAHGHSHCVMAVMSEAKQREEIELSSGLIRERLGVPAVVFAPPFGRREHYTQATLRLAAEAGCAGVVLGEGGLISVGQSPFALPRLWAREENMASFASRLEDVWPLAPTSW